ncbi:glycosyltransferase family 1 protein [Rhodoferax sp. OV413]|uniref:glycosyltransferase family 4 protein n=1 Tax=Rhodoferax sp. OV413 TaxID=1855285 RepID=UPI0025F297D6|nr:glycosyltransferase family 1 protein [Rhodoferax sp. OV413]
MKLILVTDAWLPQVNGVVTTLVELVEELKGLGHSVEVVHPGLFPTRPCPGFRGIDLALFSGKAIAARLDEAGVDAIHLATEGPLGWAARSHCLKHDLAFTTSYHTRMPEILHAALGVPLWAGYALTRHFHKPSSGVMVQTSGMLGMLADKGFRNLRSWAHGVDTQFFQYRETPQVHPALGVLARPVSLYVGRISNKKNIEAFLKLDVPGTKVVCGVGPREKDLKDRYPTVRWMGLLPRMELAQVYAAADVLVMPNQIETSGLVMLEAMASGTPVAAFPVHAPSEALGTPPKGGVLHRNLAIAWYGALSVPRHEARNRALQFSWAYASLMFAGHLVPARPGSRFSRSATVGMAITKISSET